MYGDNADGDYAIDEYGDGTGTMQSTEDGYEMGEMGEVEMMEATCLARALFTTPEEVFMARLDVINVHRHGSVRPGDPPIDFWPEGEEKLRPDPAEVAALSSQAVSGASGSREWTAPVDVVDACTAFIRRWRCALYFERPWAPRVDGAATPDHGRYKRYASDAPSWYATRGSRVVTSTEDDENDDYYFDDEDGEYYYKDEHYYKGSSITTRGYYKGDADEEVGSKTKKEKRKKPLTKKQLEAKMKKLMSSAIRPGDFSAYGGLHYAKAEDVLGFVPSPFADVWSFSSMKELQRKPWRCLYFTTGHSRCSALIHCT